MAYNVAITASAEKDLDAILRYIVEELCNVDAAVSFADEVQEKYDVLSDNPHAYEAMQHELLKQRGYRRVVISNYVMVYFIKEEESTIYIMRFFYGRQDYLKQL